MSEKIFRIELRALSPVSVTKRVFGILYETYHFIPAWTMWNTLVKLYALENSEGGRIDYKNAEERFKSVQLTNFYILEGNKILRKSLDGKRRQYISSNLKTAIDTFSGTSLDSALYEREYLTAKKFVGWVRVMAELVDFFENDLKGRTAFVGADKNTGFGKIRIENIVVVNENLLSKFDGEKEVVKKISSLRNDREGFLPIESTPKELFPIVLRRWNNEKGSGMTVVYCDG